MDQREPVGGWLAVALASLLLLVAFSGCEAESGDPLKASDGTPLKTPSEVLKEAKSLAAKPKPAR